MASIDERIAALEAKLKQEKAKKQQIEARKRAALTKVSRQQDTRRKILVGAAILAKVERGEWPKDKLLAMLDAALTRADDRALFDLQAQATEPAFLDGNEPSEPPTHITSPEKAKGRCPWRGFALPPPPPPGGSGAGWRASPFVLPPLAQAGPLWSRQGFAPSGPCPRCAAGRARQPGPLRALDPPAADTARKPGNGPTARFLAPPLPDVPPRPKTPLRAVLACWRLFGCPAVERRGRVKGEKPEAAAERKGEALSTERVRFRREARTLTLNRSGHAPGRGEGKKGRRPVCPTPLTTEGDSFPPEGGRRGETQGEAAQAVGRRGAHCGPRWGPRYAGRGAAPVGRGGTPQGCPVPRTRDLFLYINLSF